MLLEPLLKKMLWLSWALVTINQFKSLGIRWLQVPLKQGCQCYLNSKNNCQEKPILKLSRTLVTKQVKTVVLDHYQSPWNNDWELKIKGFNAIKPRTKDSSLFVQCISIYRNNGQHVRMFVHLQAFFPGRETGKKPV